MYFDVFIGSTCSIKSIVFSWLVWSANVVVGNVDREVIRNKTTSVAKLFVKDFFIKNLAEYLPR